MIENHTKFIKIKLLAFGITREMLGGSVLELEVPEGAKVADLERFLHERYPALKRLTSLFYAVNETYARPDSGLHDNDEIALIPPVSGG